MEQSIHHDYAFKVVFVQFAYCRNHGAINRYYNMNSRPSPGSAGWVVQGEIT